MPGQDEDVGVVVLAAETGPVVRVDHGGANAGKSVGGDAHADAALADQHPAVEVPREQLARNNERVLGIIHRVGRVRAEIRKRISALRQPVLQRGLDLDAAMIARQRNAQWTGVLVGDGRCGLRGRLARGGRGLVDKHNQARQGIADLVARAAVDFNGLADRVGNVLVLARARRLQTRARETSFPTRTGTTSGARPDADGSSRK